MPIYTYALGDFVRASDPPGGPLAEDYHDRIYECVVAGITHATTQPTYDTICRDYRTTATIEGRRQEIYGTACRQPDGSWQRVS